MNRVFGNTPENQSGLGLFGIVIGTPQSPEQRHIGVIHRNTESDSFLMLHLRWHCRLSNEEIKGLYLLVDPDIPRKRMRQLAAVCRLVWNANEKGGIPFGFSSPLDCMDPDTFRYLLGPTKLGLTCASFVLAVLHQSGIKLLNYGDWPIRPEDIEWQKSILESLKGVAQWEHIEALKGEIGRGALRFRPEEVAGAATESPFPVVFPSAEARGKSILELLRKTY